MDGVTEAYTRTGKLVPKLKVRSSRGTATPIAGLAGVDSEVVRQAAVWGVDVTFLNHYYHYI